MIRGILSATVCVVTLAALPASAVCTQASAKGYWKLYDVFAQPSAVGWQKCSLNISATGKISASSCQDISGASTPVTGQVNLRSAADCTYGGTLRQTSNGLINTVTEATLSENKQTGGGTGTFPGGGFVFQMIKVR